MALDWLNPLNGILEIVKERTKDKDLHAQIEARVQELREQVYIAELNTKTVPWIDAIHKMGRQLLSWASLIIPAVLVHLHPEIDPLALAAMTAPGGIYNYIKGRGR